MTYLLSLDVETTGIDPKNNSIIQIGTILYEGNNKVLAHNINLVPDKQIDLGALKVNRCNFYNLFPLSYEEKCSGWVKPDFKGKIQKEGIKEFCDFILNLVVPKVKGKIKILGHSVQFDINFIKQALENNNITGFEDIFDHNAIDTKLIATFLNSAGIINLPSISLEKLANYLQVETDSSKLHTALYDCEVAAKCYFKMLELVKGK